MLLDADAGDDVLISADLHGNRLNFNRLVQVADLSANPRRHLVMQEVCHGGPSYPGDAGCMSHLLLEDVARLKCQYPDRFHFLLSNHELAELGDFPICKSKRMLNLQFRAGIVEMYGACAADRVRSAYMQFIGTCPLAIRLSGGTFISHSLPDRCDSHTFDLGIFERPLSPADWQQGSDVFRLVWGRDYRAANAAAFAKLVSAQMLVNGHEPCASGVHSPNPQQIILDCCSGRAAYLLLPIAQGVTQAEALARVSYLHERTAEEVAAK
ncbi:hypothetical protein ETAA8_18900 [Anatilimnocola aggregata]|uniref:Calcineurin-like phosphoesterase domain-containing protein n=1 Tax=Anatilimnocola aggregata TaxID=2528021 RepID=A0A517Y992_9BACT|nr:hypothetical protein ETAA8_18900 [Anatilimnocola aggregata]